MSVILKWNFDVQVDDLPHEGAKEYFVTGTPGKVPFSVKLPYSAAADDEQVKAAIAGVEIKIKRLFAEAIIKELQSKGLMV